MAEPSRHAYLILAHEHFDQLQVLISLLDHPRNDIYLHVDRRAADFRPDQIRVRYSGLKLLRRTRVSWGGHSLITCELNLFKAAAAGQYQYYHLISGADLPLKTQAWIHSFFDGAFPNSFVDFDAQANATGACRPRVYYYHLLQDVVGRRGDGLWRLLGKADRGFVRLQKALGFRRRQRIPVYKGSNWMSITHELVCHILSREALIRKQFYFGSCADELFVQSLVRASSLRERVVEDSLRAIDWQRGTPYVYRAEDVEELLASGKLFARKFDWDADPEAIGRIAQALREEERE